MSPHKATPQLCWSGWDKRVDLGIGVDHLGEPDPGHHGMQHVCGPEAGGAVPGHVPGEWACFLPWFFYQHLVLFLSLH